MTHLDFLYLATHGPVASNEAESAALQRIGLTEVISASGFEDLGT